MYENRIIQCMIIDDEPPARTVLERYIREMPNLNLAAVCSNAIEGLNVLQKQPIDLLFLDIHLPQLKGNEFVKILTNPPQIIFTTAYADYALEGYELNATDYLLKPIQFDRFVKAINKAFLFNKSSEEKKTISDEAGTKPLYIYLRADRKMRKVLLSEIIYVESMKDYVKVFTTSGMIVSKLTISTMEAMLPAKEFIRTHRSYIVSVAKIKSFTNELIEINQTEIPIGKMFRAEVMKALT